MKHEGWALGDLGARLDADQIARLEAFEALLIERAVPNGMVGANDLPRLRSRHILDCLRGAAAVLPEETSALDMGSGAGLPGVVMAIACPQLTLTLVEVRSRRAAFVDLVIDRLGISNASVHHGRVEDMAIVVDLCLARAFASASKSWQVAEPRLSPAGRLLYWAGESFEISDVPFGVTTVKTYLSPTAALARSGPLVMMCRQ